MRTGNTAHGTVEGEHSAVRPRCSLARWSVANACVLLAASACAVALESAWPLVAGAGASFAALVVACRPRWTAAGAFGYANAVTALRLGGILALALVHARLPGAATASIALALLAADGVDGWLARRRGERSAFGAYFDKETDALLLLVLVFAAVLEQRIGGWLLAVGLLRYLFVLGAAVRAPAAGAERRTLRAGLVSVMATGAVLTCFVLPAGIYVPLAAVATAALVASFAVDVRAWFGAGRLQTACVAGTGEVRAFFDGIAEQYREQHGNAERLLAYRLRLIRRWAALTPGSTVLEIGCGDGRHLLALAGEIGRGLGVDFSPAMVAAAESRRRGSPWRNRLAFRVDDAEQLATVVGDSVDVALCVGVLEHVLDKRRAVEGAYRVLCAGGRLVCLTPDARFVWYRAIAPWLGVPTTHLSTDRLLSARELHGLLEAAGFTRIVTRPWTFTPRGDVTPLAGGLLGLLDLAGQVTRLPGCRGGLLACASKPGRGENGSGGDPA